VNERLTLATSSGLALVVLAFHVATGLVALIAGSLALSVRKGGVWHRRSGLIFAYSMIATGIAITGVHAFEGRPFASGGFFIIYFVLTAWTTVRPLPAANRQVEVGLMIIALAMAAQGLVAAATAIGSHSTSVGGVPVGMVLFTSVVLLLAVVGDARMFWSNGIHGTRRIARHLWRMCFALFIASGSFLLGQMQFIPRPLRVLPVLMFLAVLPLLLLLYWMWRVRLRRNIRGLLTTQAIET
jgi:hypothetical protein